MNHSGMPGKLLCLLAALVFAAVEGSAELEFPPLSGRIVDQAKLLSEMDNRELSAMLAEHEQRTGNQVVVVTLLSLNGYEIADYGYQLGRHWGIGQAGRDNGALLIVVPGERKVRIEVGYGLEGDLTDARSHQIIQQEILPRFKAGDFPGGIRLGVQGILAAIEGKDTVQSAPAQSSNGVSQDLIGAMPFFVIVTILFLREFLGGLGRGSRAVTSFFTGGIAALVAWLFTRILFVSIAIGILLALIAFFSGGPGGPGRFGRRNRGYYGGYDGGLFGGGGFSSGGGFGGGGGSFGGGGASGRW